MYVIDYNSYRAVKSFNRRVRFLVMHYTALDFQKSIEALTGEKVSAHYLVPDPNDASYQAAGFKGVRIFNLVEEYERAWHAGVSAWKGRTNINDSSIGIEIVNRGGETVGQGPFPPYDPIQIKAVIELALNILQRYPDITPTQVVAHSDIAVGRKKDPGPSFPWKQLYDAGIGAWYEEGVKNAYLQKFSKSLPKKEEILKKFEIYGYDTAIAQTEEGYKSLLFSFQIHFRPQKYDGVLDVETAAVLYALVDKYFPE